MPQWASARATLVVVRGDHFTPVMGSPAVSYSNRNAIRVTRSAVFFPRGAARRPRGAPVPAPRRDPGAVADRVRRYAHPDGGTRTWKRQRRKQEAPWAPNTTTGSARLRARPIGLARLTAQPRRRHRNSSSARINAAFSNSELDRDVTRSFSQGTTFTSSLWTTLRRRLMRLRRRLRRWAPDGLSRQCEKERVTSLSSSEFEKAAF